MSSFLNLAYRNPDSWWQVCDQIAHTWKIKYTRWCDETKMKFSHSRSLLRSLTLNDYFRFLTRVSQIYVHIKKWRSYDDKSFETCVSVSKIFVFIRPVGSLLIWEGRRGGIEFLIRISSLCSFKPVEIFFHWIYLTWNIAHRPSSSDSLPYQSFKLWVNNLHLNVRYPLY